MPQVPYAHVSCLAGQQRLGASRFTLASLLRPFRFARGDGFVIGTKVEAEPLDMVLDLPTPNFS